MSPITARRALPFTAAAAVLFVVATAEAHDFWLVPDAFHVAEGGELVVRGQTSSRFPTSESAVTPDRISEVRVLGATEDVRASDLGTSGSSLMLKHRPQGAGQRIVAVTIAPRSLRASGPGFKRYIELEGNVALAARYEREGLLPKTDSITRRYAKYAKTFVEVGSGGPRSFSRVVGHPAEFIPLRDPSALRAGDTLPVRLLYKGRPLGGFHVHAGVAVPAGNPRDVSFDTDAQGIIRLPITEPGLWNVRALHVVPSDRGSGADWDSHFATMVFSVAGANPSSSDSAAVVQTVGRYSAALAAGDSSAALALLTADAVILESGGVETREQYRAGHLRADVAFAAGVPSQRTVRRVQVSGDMAWVASSSTTQGEFRGRAINSVGAELMVLTRTGSGWRISAIHWSSRERR